MASGRAATLGFRRCVTRHFSVRRQATPLDFNVSKSMETKSVKWGRFGLAMVIGNAASAQLLAMLYYLHGPHGLTMEVLPKTTLLAMMYLTFMLPIALVVGAPFAMLLNRVGYFKGWVVVLLGTLTGALWAIPAIDDQPVPHETALFFGLGGFASSLVFWVVYASADKAD